MFRTVLETMRTLFVWLVRLCLTARYSPGFVSGTAPYHVRCSDCTDPAQVDLLLFYTSLGGGTLGESWSVYSYIQALGCVAGLYRRALADHHVLRHAKICRAAHFKGAIRVQVCGARVRHAGVRQR